MTSRSHALPPALLAAFALLSTPGCMVLDEIDKASAQLPASKQTKSTDEAKQTAQAEEGNPLLEKSKQWWDEAKSLSPAESTSSIVRCRLPEGTQFMDRDDCRARGGHTG